MGRPLLVAGVSTCVPRKQSGRDHSDKENFCEYGQWVNLSPRLYHLYTYVMIPTRVGTRAGLKEIKAPSGIILVNTMCALNKHQFSFIFSS